MRKLAFLSACALALAGCDPTTYIAQSSRAEAPEISCLTQPQGGCSFSQSPLRVLDEPVELPRRPYKFFPTADPLNFVDAQGKSWNAPPRTLTDGASIPKIFISIVGDPTSPEYINAAAVHDAYCGVGNEELSTYRKRGWREVHRMFYEALLVNGTPPKKAKIMYAAVFLGGPRWNEPDVSLSHIPDEVLLQEMEWCLEWIDLVDPMPDEIAQWMEDRGQLLLSGEAQTMPAYLREASDPRKF